MVRKPRDSERALYVEGSLGKASNSASGVGTISSIFSMNDAGDADRSRESMAVGYRSDGALSSSGRV